MVPCGLAGHRHCTVSVSRHTLHLRVVIFFFFFFSIEFFYRMFLDYYFFFTIYTYSRTPLIRPPSESHCCGRIRGMVAREGFVYEEKPLSVTRNVVV